jgi:hypothetical protein
MSSLVQQCALTPRVLPLLAVALALGGAGCNCSGGGGADDAGACEPSLACGTNAGAPCRAGVTACSPTAACVDGTPADDGTACGGTDVCAGGACRPSVTLAAPLNLSRDAITPGRSCAEAPRYPVLTVTSGGVTVEGPVDAGCLDPGDEVLLIDLQGTGAATAEVGTWEVHRVSSRSGGAVSFDAPVARAYGALGDGGQQVALLRIPGYGALGVAAGAVITADPWDGRTGGVVAMRAARLDLQGSISAVELGYRSGRWSRDDSSCSDNVQTEAGESIGGRGQAGTAANAGGSGGIGPGSGLNFVSNEPTSATAGHAQAGNPGSNYNGRDAQEPGHAYGSGDGGTLTLGSGGGGSLTCEVSFPGPALVDPVYHAGGIVLLYTGTLQVGAGGTITAAGKGYDDRWAGAGGSVMIRGGTLALGEGRVTAAGGVEIAHGAAPATAASPGYVSVFYVTSASGTTDPPAFSAQVSRP